MPELANLRRMNNPSPATPRGNTGSLLIDFLDAVDKAELCLEGDENVATRRTGLAKNQVTAVLDKLSDLVQRHRANAGVKPNPFKRGEMMEVNSRPARRIVKERALKALKDMA